MTSLFRPELLVPAGDMEKFRTAVLYGAHAVYLGGTSGNLRASSKGFSGPDLRAALAEARARNIRVYYCLNSLPFERDMKAIPSAVDEAAQAGVDAFIIADPGVLRVARCLAPDIPVHISTQANTTNAEAVRFWTDAGACRVNLARELSCRDIHAIRKALPHTELEVFIHGAVCLAVSGQCLLSAWLNNRPANQGRCTQPCRFEYKAVDATIPPAYIPPEEALPELVLEEALRPGAPLWTVCQDEPYADILAPDDLCLLPYLRWFVRNRITSLKIEGRMKGSSYVAHVTDAFRTAIDTASADTASFDWRPFLPDLARTASRTLSTGFFVPGRRLSLARPGWPKAPRTLLARAAEPLDAEGWLVDIRGKWNAATPVEVMLPGMRRPVITPGDYALENLVGERTAEVNSGMRAVLRADASLLAGLEPGVFLRGL